MFGRRPWKNVPFPPWIQGGNERISDEEFEFGRLINFSVFFFKLSVASLFELYE